MGERARLASLEIGGEQGAMAGNCDSGYSCTYSSTDDAAARDVLEDAPVAGHLASGDRGQELLRYFHRDAHRYSHGERHSEAGFGLAQPLRQRLTAVRRDP